MTGYWYGIPHIVYSEKRHYAVGRAANLGRTHPEKTEMDLTKEVKAYEKE